VTPLARPFPQPQTRPPVGHLGRWGTEPLDLLEEGARTGPAFALRLWRRAVVGYSPDWNRMVLRDLDTFRSAGSLSRLTPYLAGGVVRADDPAHHRQRSALNPPFRHDALSALRPALTMAVRQALPTGEFDAVPWAAGVVRRLLAVAFFGGRFPEPLLAEFLAPLDRDFPAPFLRRPWLFRRMNRALARSLQVAEAGTLLAAVRDSGEDAIEQVRVALGAAYDTTAHTLAWLLWHLAARPQPVPAAEHRQLLDETLRLYPAGWVGSRVCSRDTEFGGHLVTAGTLVLYSPYLTHRDAGLWPDPLCFRPERFARPPAAFTFIPFAAGARRCLGMHLARLLLLTVLEVVSHERTLVQVRGEPRPRAGLTLAPSGPLVLR